MLDLTVGDRHDHVVLQVLLEVGRESSNDETLRPWTIQRYYDWRTSRFELPG